VSPLLVRDDGHCYRLAGYTAEIPVLPPA